MSTSAEKRMEVAVVLHQHLSRLSRELRALKLPHGMTTERLRLLSTIDRCGPMSVTSLALAESVRPPTMSRMVASLIDDGLLKRGATKDDARIQLLTVTAKGRRIYHSAHKRRTRHFAVALARLSDDERAAIHALTTHLERFTLARG